MFSPVYFYFNLHGHNAFSLNDQGFSIAFFYRLLAKKYQ